MCFQFRFKKSQFSLESREVREGSIMEKRVKRTEISSIEKDRNNRFIEKGERNVTLTSVVCFGDSIKFFLSSCVP